MKRLDAAVHHFGKTGDVGDAYNGKTRLLQRFGGPAGRYELEAARGQSSSELDQAGFV
jgi:hypothetical protein